MKRMNREAKRYRDRHFFAPAIIDQPEPEGNKRGVDDDRLVDITTRHLTFALFKSRTPYDGGAVRYRGIGGKN